MGSERWTYEETSLFLDICLEKQIVKMMDEKKFRNDEIYKTVKEEMCAKGYNRETGQLIIKFRNLKEQYKKIKDKNSKSGAGRSFFAFQDKMAMLLENRPVNNFPTQFGMESNSDDLNATLELEESSVSSPSSVDKSPPPSSVTKGEKKSGRSTYVKALKDNAEAWKDNLDELQREFLKEQERLQIQQQDFENKEAEKRREFEKNMANEERAFLAQIFSSLLHPQYLSPSSSFHK